MSELKTFRVNLSATFTVEAEDEVEAENKAYEMLKEELKEGYYDLWNVFGAYVEEVEDKTKG